MGSFKNQAQERELQMKLLLLLLPFFGTITSLPQINFADSQNKKDNTEVNFNQVENQVSSNARASIFVAEYEDEEKNDTIEDVDIDIDVTNVNNNNTFCCCIPESDTCNEPESEQDLIGAGNINVRCVLVGSLARMHALVMEDLPWFVKQNQEDGQWLDL